MSSYPLRARLILLAISTTVAAGAGWLVWSVYGGPRSTAMVEEGEGADKEKWNGQRGYAVDETVGLRPRRMTTLRMPMGALDGTDVQQIVKHRDADAWLRERPVPAGAERVIVIGDSHVDGVVSTADNFTTLLEDQLQGREPPVAVLNAGCGNYSLWQYYLRCTDLLPAFRPRLLVVVVFLGNDLIELDKPTEPHLDDDLVRQPGRAADHRPATQRKRDLALVDPYGQLFWQGMNQALYVHRHPEREAVLMKKARHAITSLQSLAGAHDCELLWVLLPSFDLAFPEGAGISPLAKEVIAAGVQRRLRDGVADILAQTDSDVVDLEPVFRRDGKIDLYAVDFHIFRRAHRLIADRLRDEVASRLR